MLDATATAMNPDATGKHRRMNPIRWWRAWRKRRACLHHDRRGGQSWIREQLINNGAGKMMWCRECERTWFV